MIDGDNWNGSFEEIGSLETTMGALMGARKQMYMDRLSKNGSEKKNGIIIIRSEAVDESNSVAQYQFKWSNVNNKTAGFLGMCQAQRFYRFTVERRIPDSKKIFAIVSRSHF